MPERSNDRIAAAHAVLGAVLHSSIYTDPQSSPDGFRDARELGLVYGPNPRLTPAGRAVLVLLGVTEQ